MVKMFSAVLRHEFTCDTGPYLSPQEYWLITYREIISIELGDRYKFFRTKYGEGGKSQVFIVFVVL